MLGLGRLRRVRRFAWPLTRGSFATPSAEPAPVEHGAALVTRYAAPILNPASQRHIFENKLHNIRLCLAPMEQLRIAPGEIFSFWRLAGRPIAERGFRSGSAFIRQRVTEAVGGGICQLSGVLYNLALLSGCRILERHAHSIDAYGEDRYVPLGRDATVSWPYKDLCFQNPHDTALSLSFELEPTELRGFVHADRDVDCTVSIEVKRLRTVPSPVVVVPSAEPVTGLTGSVVRTWRQMKTKHGRVQREWISTDRYRATPTLIREKKT